jgi:hypothetical protein
MAFAARNDWLFDVRCRPKRILLFSAKDLFANDAEKLDATANQATR